VPFTPPRIYPITDTRISGLSHAEEVARLIEGGATLIQLREKHASPAEFFEAAKTAIDIARNHDVRIIINDRVDIALALKADGVHLGQDDLPPEKARDILGRDAIIGFSTHTIEQALAAAKMPVDYIAFGPIFPTKTKENPSPVVGIETLAAVRKIVGEIPLIAIGGIDKSNVQNVLNAGADVTAIVSYLISEPDQISPRMQELFSIVGN
jgi:thiamine-phosphate pyrophosphorylase